MEHVLTHPSQYPHEATQRMARYNCLIAKALGIPIEHVLWAYQKAHTRVQIVSAPAAIPQNLVIGENIHPVTSDFGSDTVLPGEIVVGENMSSFAQSHFSEIDLGSEKVRPVVNEAQICYCEGGLAVPLDIDDDLLSNQSYVARVLSGELPLPVGVSIVNGIDTVYLVRDA